MNMVVHPVALLFLFLVVLLVGCIVFGVYRGEGKRMALVCGGLLFAWLAVVGALALQGFFLQFSSVPPRLGYAFIVMFIMAISVGVSRRTKRMLTAIPQHVILALQSFRIVMEYILWRLFLLGLIPHLMTFQGKNFDVLVGVSAPVMSFLAYKKGEKAVKLLVVWNIIGILLLTNVVVHAFLSIPTPFRVFVNDLPNVAAAYFPFVWIPSFVVPFAFFLHVISLRRMLRTKSTRS